MKTGSSGSIHSGHRARMRSRYRETGLTGFSAHEALELILYSAIPLRDVNPLAHALIDRFGSLDAVLSASEEELRQVPGVGPRTSAILRALDNVCRLYDARRFSGVRTLSCIRDVLNHAETAYHRTYTNELLVMYEDAFGTLLTIRAFPARLNDPAVLHEALGLALSLHAHSVVLLVKGFLPLRRLSKTELDEIGRLIHLFSAADIYVLDCVMRSGEYVLSLRMEELLTDEKGGGRSAMPARYYWYEPLNGLKDTAGWRRVTKDLLIHPLPPAGEDEPAE